MRRAAELRNRRAPQRGQVHHLPSVDRDGGPGRQLPLLHHRSERGRRGREGRQARKDRGIVPTKKIVPTTVEIVDVAGLVRGASKGEGLGNRFLGHIRETGAVIHVARCFDDPDVVHVDGSVSPARDVAAVADELALADLETAERRLAALEKSLKGLAGEAAAKAGRERALLETLRDALGEGRPARNAGLSPEERRSALGLGLLTMKPVLYLCNVDEAGLAGDNAHVRAVRDLALAEGAPVLKACGKLESEIAALPDPKDREEFLREAGLAEPSLAALTREGHRILGLGTFFTAGPKEVRAWTFKNGATAREAAGSIHSDFARGFIRAEVRRCDDLFRLGSEAAVRDAGRLRTEGRDYVVQDGDIIHFRFNV